MVGWEIPELHGELGKSSCQAAKPIRISNKPGLNTKGEWDIISGDKKRMIVNMRYDEAVIGRLIVRIVPSPPETFGGANGPRAFLGGAVGVIHQ